MAARPALAGGKSAERMASSTSSSLSSHSCTTGAPCTLQAHAGFIVSYRFCCKRHHKLGAGTSALQCIGLRAEESILQLQALQGDEHQQTHSRQQQDRGLA